MNGFDKLAKKAEPAKSKKSTKIAATATDQVKEAVDRYINLNAQIKDLEAEHAAKGDLIIQHVVPQQEEAARTGNFSKSLEVLGKVGTLTLTLSDYFSVPQDDDSQTALKALLKKQYDDYFEKKRSVSLKKNVLDDEKLTNKILGLLEKAKIDVNEIFDVVDKIVAKPDLDRKQFDLKPEELAEFRTLVKQKKASLK